MRERSKIMDGPAVNYEYKQLGLGYACNQQSIEPNIIDTFSGTFVENSDSVVMHDVVTEDFHKLQAMGRIINNPMDSVRTTLVNRLIAVDYGDGRRFWNTVCNPDGWQYYFDGVKGTRPSSHILGDHDSLPEIPAYSLTDDIDRAVTSAWGNCNSTELQSLVMVGESQKTVLSIVAIFKRLIKIIKMVKKLDTKGLGTELTLKQLSDRYMELRYALRPLMYDAKNTIGALTQTAADFSKRQTFRGKATYQDSQYTRTYPKTTYTSTHFGGREYGHTLEEAWERMVFVRAGVLTQLEQLSSFNTWGLTQPLESFWELVPFSFIVDWFINVGDTIAAFTPMFGMKPLASWYVTEDITYRYRTASSPWWKPADDTSIREVTDWYNFFSKAHISEHIVTKTRVPNPIRSILPTLNVNLNAFKIADMVIIAKHFMSR